MPPLKFTVSCEEDKPSKLGVYPRRWIILFISCTAIFLRGFNQSCYGPINSVFVKFLDIRPWQVDWFILTQSVVFLSMALPLSWFTSRIGFRKSYILMTTSLFIGFVLTAVGVSFQSGFPSVIVGQGIMGFSNIISWSIPPPTAAIWFPTREVATAVALQVVGRGIGESVGSILTPLLLKVSFSVEKIGRRSMWIFSSLTLLSFLLCIASVIFVVDAPPLPPSESQALALKKKASKANKQSIRDTLSEYKKVIKALFSDSNFIAIWFVFGAINPVLRNNSVLLSSTLQNVFSNEEELNVKAGFVLMGGWMAFTAGGFIAGPLITKTQKFKAIVSISVGFECVSTLLVMLGMRFSVIACVYIGVVLTGLSLGLANTSLYELSLEVTYPNPPMLVTMINIVIMGVFRLIYPIIGRATLSQYGATASLAFPLTLLLLSTIILVVIKPPYKRSAADRGESRALLDDSDGET